MAVFAALYYWSYIQPSADAPRVGVLLDEVLRMPRDQQLDVLQRMAALVGGTY